MGYTCKKVTTPPQGGVELPVNRFVSYLEENLADGSGWTQVAYMLDGVVYERYEQADSSRFGGIRIFSNSSDSTIFPNTRNPVTVVLKFSLKPNSKTIFELEEGNAVYDRSIKDICTVSFILHDPELLL